MSKKSRKYEGVKVLVVEDDRNICKDIVDFLERNGCSVNAYPDAYSGRSAIVNGCNYDILFTDIAMEGKVGGEHIIDASRHFNPNVPIVVISETRAYSLKESTAKYKEGFLATVPNADRQIKKINLNGRKIIPGKDILECLGELLV